MRRIAVVMVSVMWLLVAQSAAATTIPATCGNLQTALNSANNGDVIQLTGICTTQSFTITNTNKFTLQGVGMSKGIPSSGFNGSAGGSSPILNSSSPVRLTIKNLLFENATLTSGGGAAIQFDADGIAVTITGDVFSHLSSGTYGGAIQIEDNTDGAGSPVPTVISRNKFENNTAGDGGAIYWSNGGPLRLLNNTFTGNAQNNASALYPVGGAVDIENYEGTSGVPSTWLGSPITVSGNTFGGSASGAGNSALGAGGALFVSVQGGEGLGEKAQAVTLTKNRFIGNAVTGTPNQLLYGGAVGMTPQIREYGFKVTQTGNLFQNNRVTGALSSGYAAGGGAEWGIALRITSTRDRFLGNRLNVTGSSFAPPLGGAVGILSTNQYIGTASSTTLLRASFTGLDDLFRSNSDPSANGWGGAIYTGGISTPNCPSPTACPSTLALYDSTVVKNMVATSGQGAAIWGGPKDSLTIDNSIVYGNRGPAGAPEIYGYFKRKYAYDDACTVAGGTKPLPGTGNICLNPKLKVPSATETSQSPTIDRGSNLFVPKFLRIDLAGHRRITEGKPTTCRPIVDMGAFESVAVKPSPTCHK